MNDNDGLNPVPGDSELESWLVDQILDDKEKLLGTLMDLVDSIKDKMESGQPRVFAYGKLLNYLRSDEHFSEPDRIRMLAAALWMLAL